MTCPSCESENPDSNQYCGHCGVSLDVKAEQLRLQVKTIVEQNFKDRDSIVASLADSVSSKVETRLKGMWWILGSASAVLALSASIWGFETFEKTKADIETAKKVAVDSISSTAQVDKRTIDDASKEWLGQLKQEATPSLNALSQFPPKIKTMQAKLEETRQKNEALNAQIQGFRNARDENPQATIGSLPQQLFQSSYIVGTLPYLPGDTRSGVSTIQSRLKQLNCYTGEISGSYDGATDAAVKAWKGAVKPSTLGAPTLGTPSSIDVLVNRPTYSSLDGQGIGTSEWDNLFSPLAASCL
jgi:hypothetical protein